LTKNIKLAIVKNMPNLYTISELSKLTNYCRLTISKYLEKDKNFKKIIVKNQIKYKTGLNSDEILRLFKEIQQKNFKKKGRKKPP
jgi:hypothetical protein